MTRFLFVVPPFAGHTNPTVSVASALSDRGHEVAWVGYGGAIGHLLPVDAKIFDLGGEMPEGMAAMIGEKAASLRGLENLKFFCEDVLLPLASSMREGVDDAIDRYLPDVLVV
ncbi:MAG: glycosyltransferase, partial [Planctomycetota bacterium]|nr:glycosyltransferase [Planctomycetota bacterium]